MAWLAITVVIAAMLAWVAFRLRHGGTIYLSYPGGFRSYSFGAGESEPRSVPRDRYERILRRLIQGDLFDFLWISHNSEDDGGLGLYLEEGEVEMHVSFLSLKEPERLADFRQSMRTWGYTPTAEDPWNEGMGEDLESVTFRYRFEKDLECVRQAAERALGALEGPAGSELFVQAWRSQDGPRGTGIKVVPKRDVLAEVP
jgi:hypothetical protein